jgi:hypothetical protein
MKFLIFNFKLNLLKKFKNHFCNFENKIKIQISFKFKFLLAGINCKLQFDIYLVPTKPLVVPETLRKLIQILMRRTVYSG